MADEEDEEKEGRRLAKREGRRGFSPFQEMDSIFEDLNRTLDRFFGEPTSPVKKRRRGITTPAIDMQDLGDKYQIEADIPGIDKDDLEIELRDDSLVIEGETSEETEEEGEDYIRRERGYRSFYRQLPMPKEVNEEQVTAELDRGVLTVDLPKEEPEEKEGKKIEIQ